MATDRNPEPNQMRKQRVAQGNKSERDLAPTMAIAATAKVEPQNMGRAPAPHTSQCGGPTSEARRIEVPGNHSGLCSTIRQRVMYARTNTSRDAAATIESRGSFGILEDSAVI